MSDMKVIVGGDLEDDAAAWHRTERCQRVRERVLAFECWEGLAQDHVWMAPGWQGFFRVLVCAVTCGHVSGLYARCKTAGPDGTR